MLTVLFNWGYIFVTAFLIGFAVLLPFERGGAAAGRAPGGGTGTVRRKMTAVLMAGLAAALTTVLSVRLVMQSTLDAISAAARATSDIAVTPLSTISNP